MLDDPMFTAELIAEKREAEDAEWRALQAMPPGYIGHGSHRPGAVCLECERIDAAWRAQYQDIRTRYDGTGSGCTFCRHAISEHDGPDDECTVDSCPCSGLDGLR